MPATPPDAAPQPATAAPTDRGGFVRAVVWLWPCLVAATVFLASGRSQVSSPQIIGFDKVAHFFVFGLLGNLVQRALPATRHRAALAVALVSLYGLGDEWHQAFTPGRSVEFGDWLCDTLGAALAVSCYEGTRWYRQALELRLRWRRRRPTPATPTPARPPGTALGMAPAGDQARASD